MTKLISTVFAGLLITGAAFAQTPMAASHDTPAMTSTPSEADCESKEANKAGAPLSSAEASAVERCEADAAKAVKTSACEAKAVSKDGKALSGEAEISFVKQCMGA